VKGFDWLPSGNDMEKRRTTAAPQVPRDSPRGLATPSRGSPPGVHLCR
jgi:hypothetical protein